MNYQYRRNPVTIEAFQMTAEHRSSNVEWPEWLHYAWNKEYTEPGSLYPVASSLLLSGAEEDEDASVVSLDYWIIRGEQGNLYLCKPDTFAATYTATV